MAAWPVGRTAQTPQSARVLASMAEDEDTVMLMGEDDESFGTVMPQPFATPARTSGGDSATVDANIEALEIEKNTLLQERVAIEEEKVQIESQANIDKRHYHVNRQRMEKTLMDLTVNIKLKQDLIRELAQSEQVGTSNLLSFPTGCSAA